MFLSLDRTWKKASSIHLSLTALDFLFSTENYFGNYSGLHAHAK